MIVEERMRTFINSLDPGEPAWLDEIRSSALQDNDYPDGDGKSAAFSIDSQTAVFYP